MEEEWMDERLREIKWLAMFMALRCFVGWRRKVLLPRQSEEGAATSKERGSRHSRNRPQEGRSRVRRDQRTQNQCSSTGE